MHDCVLINFLPDLYNHLIALGLVLWFLMLNTVCKNRPHLFNKPHIGHFRCLLVMENSEKNALNAANYSSVLWIEPGLSCETDIVYTAAGPLAQ